MLDSQIFSRTVLLSDPGGNLQSQAFDSLGNLLGLTSEFPFGDSLAIGLLGSPLRILRRSQLDHSSRRWDIQGSHIQHQVHPRAPEKRQNDFNARLMSEAKKFSEPFFLGNKCWGLGP